MRKKIVIVAIVVLQALVGTFVLAAGDLEGTTNQVPAKVLQVGTRKTDSAALTRKSIMLPIISVVGLLALLYLLSRALQRMTITRGGKIGKRRVRVEERLGLDVKKSLLLISFDGQDILLGVTNDKFTVIQCKKAAEEKEEETED